MVDLNKKKKLLVTIIWKIIKKMIKYCQQTTTNKTGYFICMEVVRTKVAQTKYQLLQPYMDHTNIINYTWLWKQIITFFVHMQKKKNEKQNNKLKKKKKKKYI